MRAYFDQIQWSAAQNARKWQRLLGRISGIFFAAALLALFDGLLAEMRGGNNELELLPGQAITLSGPCALKNPLDSDLVIKFTPQTGDLSFNLEGYYTGYWFGSAMWRGALKASATARPGDFRMGVSFRGVSAQSAQQYFVRVFANARAQRAAAKSLFRRFLDVNPFIIAAFGGGLGIALGLFTYYFGRRYAIMLGAMGLYEIYRKNETDGRIWCLSPASLASPPGASRIVLDADGRQLAEARIEEWKKGKLVLSLLDGNKIPDSSALVCLKPPEKLERALKKLEAERKLFNRYR